MVIEGGCLKFGVLFWFSTIFAVLGLFIVALGVIVQVVYFNDPQLVEYNFFSGPGLLILIGAFVFVIAFVGCCGAMKESHRLITMFSVLLLVLCVLELAAGIASYVKRGELESIIEDRLNTTIHEYPDNKEVQKTWNIMQHELGCCGVNGPTDWTVDSKNNTVPSSCCREVPFNDSTNLFECQISQAYPSGCKTVLLGQLKNKSLILGLAATGIAVIEIAMIMFSCSLARAIRKDYQTV